MHQHAAEEFKQCFDQDLPQLGLMNRRDADKLRSADGLKGNATAADVMRHARTKEHAPGLAVGPAAWHITKVAKHVARANQPQSGAQQSGEKRTVAEDVVLLQGAMRRAQQDKMLEQGKVWHEPATTSLV